MNNHKIIKYEKDNISLDVRYDEENKTIWLTQSEIAILFETTKNNITKRLKALINGKGSEYNSPLCVKEELVNNQLTKLYNLDMIEAISLGSKSSSAYDFVKWARDYINNNPQQSIAKFSPDEAIKSKIYIIRGEKVMLDFELAELYGYTTSAFNQQVNNNIEKFESDFMFQLTNEELNLILISKNLTSSWGGTRKLPYAFTEQGIYMLMTVLNGELAIKQSKMLIRTFKAMKDYIVESNNLISSNELLKLTNTINEKFSKVEERQDNTDIKLEKVMNFFNDPSTYKEFLFVEGQKIDASNAYQSIYKLAKLSIIVIDDYIDIKTLLLLKICKPNIKITIITDNEARNKLDQIYINEFIKETSFNLIIKENHDTFHDRYIILDYGEKEEMAFLCGTSSKDAGKNCDAIVKLNDFDKFKNDINKVLNNQDVVF